MRSDLLLIGWVWLMSLALQLLGWGLVKGLGKKMRDGGWVMGRMASWLMVSLMVWSLGHLGLRVNNGWGIGVAILSVLVWGVLMMRERRKNGVKKWLKKEWWKWILVEEGLFLIGLVGLSVVRGFEPSIFSLEKFMDYGFVRKYMISEVLPVEDIWFAGKSLNYYSFGHFMVSVLVRIWGVGLEVGYNLALGFILGTGLSLSFGIITNLGERKRGSDGSWLVGGVMGALLTCLGGNSYTWWYLLKHGSWQGFWYADATRFIERTIHEFPGYSFVVSDLHAHLLDFPVVLVFMLMLVIWVKEKKKRVGVEMVMGGLLGVMMMTNTWDVLVYGLVGIAVMVRVLVEEKRGKWGVLIDGVLKTGVRVMMVMLVVCWQWWISFEAIPSGLRRADEHSGLESWLILWGGHLLLMVLVWLVSGKEKVRERLWLRGVVGVAVVLLLIPEIVYVEDIYTGYPRANTMFKLTYQAFILMSLVVGWLVGWGWEKGRKRGGKAVLLIAMVLWLGMMVFPYQSFPVYYLGLKDYQGSNGLEWMRLEEGNKWEAVKYLEDHYDGRSLLEATGDSYTRFNSVSAFSGTSSVLGWRVHEWLWRGGYDQVRERELNVKTMLEMKDEEVVVRLMSDYGIGWVYLGKEEMNGYEVNKEGLEELGEVVWEGVGAELIRVSY